MEGDEVSFRYLTDKKGSAVKYRMGTHMEPIKEDDKDFSDILRLAFWKVYLEKVLRGFSPDFVGVEGYALKAKTNSGYQIGELGGIARVAMWSLGIPYRVHDPLSVKFFAVGDGSAKPDDLFFALPQDLQDIFSNFDLPKAKKAKKQNTQTSRDLGVAYWVAKMIQTEAGLRDGSVLMGDLDPSQIRAFNRVTKSNPVNILAKDWISR